MKRDTFNGAEPDRLAIPVARRDHIQGPGNASITLVEYGDYECPYCGQAYGVIKMVQERLGKRLRFVFRNFPLTNIHLHAEHAAEAAEAAAAQAHFWEMHDVLYENQDALEDEDLTKDAEELGLDATRLIAEVEAGAYARRLREDFMSGIRSGVNGTPTFFINEERYDGEGGAVSLLAALLAAEKEPQTPRHK